MIQKSYVSIATGDNDTNETKKVSPKGSKSRIPVATQRQVQDQTETPPIKLDIAESELLADNSQPV